MEREKFDVLMKEKINKIDVEINEIQLDQFYKYMNILIEWNKKINLTAIIDPEDIILKHFIDSIAISKYLIGKEKLIDIGTGAGFPGIPLKIMNQDLQVILLDSLNKRIHFLKTVIQELKLTKIEAFHGRAEEFGRNIKYREKFDVVTSRAVSNIATLSEYMIPFTKIGGICIYMKGSEITKEIKEGENAIKILGGKIKNIDNYNLADTNINRNNIIILKERATPNKYPRKPGMPSKEPIK